MKDVKKLLSENAKAILPDDNVKKNIKRELGMEETDATLVYAHGGERVAPNLKIKLISICAAAMAVILALCFLLPALKNQHFPSPDRTINSCRSPMPILSMLTVPRPSAC